MPFLAQRFVDDDVMDMLKAANACERSAVKFGMVSNQIHGIGAFDGKPSYFGLLLIGISDSMLHAYGAAGDEGKVKVVAVHILFRIAAKRRHRAVRHNAADNHQMDIRTIYQRINDFDRIGYYGNPLASNHVGYIQRGRGCIQKDGVSIFDKVHTFAGDPFLAFYMDMFAQIYIHIILYSV
jgi:hypothetical protein